MILGLIIMLGLFAVAFGLLFMGTRLEPLKGPDKSNLRAGRGWD